MRKNLQFASLFISTFIIRHKKFIGLGCIIGFFTALFFISAYPFYTKSITQKYKKIGVVGRFNERNLPLFIQNQISLGLTSLTASGEAAPSIAKSWEVDAEGKIYTFYLKSEVYWHSGKPFTIQDINYKLEGATFTPIDEKTLRISLREPYAPLPVVLSRPLLKPSLDGLGVYKVTRIKYTGDTISELVLTPQKSGLVFLTYKFYSSVDSALLAYKLGEINTINNIPDVGDLKTWKNIKISTVNLYDRYVGVFLNVKNPLFKEKEVRQALAYAIPRFEGFEKAHTPISPLSWAYSQKIRLYRFDPEAAKKILSKSPIASPSTQLTLTTFAALLKTAQKIASAWSKVGLNVKVKVESSIPTDYQALLATQLIPPDPDQYQYWQSTQEATNLTDYNNLKIDKLLEDGRKTLDKETRKKIYADFQRYLVDDVPVIFLYYPKVYIVERK